MNTDLEGILSACLYLHVSFYPGVVNFCRYVFFNNWNRFIQETVHLTIINMIMYSVINRGERSKCVFHQEQIVG
jgi:hypothetical protein